MKSLDVQEIELLADCMEHCAKDEYNCDTCRMWNAKVGNIHCVDSVLLRAASVFRRMLEVEKKVPGGKTVIVNVGDLKRPIKPKSNSTLFNMKKADLVDYIRCLEHNYNVAVSFNENQARYIETLNIPEVAHGTWEPHPKYAGFERCSVCHDATVSTDWVDGKKWKFCPECGAVMDGGGEGVQTG